MSAEVIHMKLTSTSIGYNNLPCSWRSKVVLNVMLYIVPEYPLDPISKAQFIRRAATVPNQIGRIKFGSCTTYESSLID